MWLALHLLLLCLPSSKLYELVMEAPQREAQVRPFSVAQVFVAWIMTLI